MYDDLGKVLMVTGYLFAIYSFTSPRLWIKMKEYKKIAIGVIVMIYTSIIVGIVLCKI